MTKRAAVAACIEGKGHDKAHVGSGLDATKGRVFIPMTFSAFFEAAMGHAPRPYQRKLADEGWPETLVVPTGFGKTAAVLAAWLWKVKAEDAGTPRRLVYCLPMRTLVEQTEKAAQRWIDTARRELGLDEVHLEVLMGGRGRTRRRIPDWIMRADEPTILIGTQDLLISAALMRGYAVSRYRWPVDFALLHNDALWVFDEVQLTSATLATSAQMEAFRRQFGTAKRSRTLWMSATLDPAWLETVDFKPADRYRANDLSAEDLDRAPNLWLARKSLARLDVGKHDFGKKDSLATYAAAVVREAIKHALPGTNTILFFNTVARAQAVFKALEQRQSGFDLLLVHSRFRAAERRRQIERLNEDVPQAGRLIVATQALEAGVDVTSAVMMTEIAPWSSLVQRFGRCNRYGECGEVGAEIFWIDLPDEAAAPYDEHELREAREKLAGLAACGPADLAAMPPSAPARGQVIRRRDLLDLFDTDPDLSGFDVDVSIYVRDAQDTDVRLFWRPVAEGTSPPADAPGPERDELCPAPIGGTKELVKRAGGRAWRWDALAKEWAVVWQDGVFPGLVLWIDAAVGGYDPARGFDPASKQPVEPVDGADTTGETPDDIGDNRDSHTKQALVSLAKHTDHVRAEAVALAAALGLDGDERAILVETALWHDWGKAHDAFVALTAATRMERNTQTFLAKWPQAPKGAKLPEGARKYFRHELASALGFMAAHGWKDEASLAAYLIAAHHGKVRMRLRALPNETPPRDNRLFARGVHDGDRLPALRLGEADLPETALDLDIMQLGDSERCGASWSARAQRLLKEHGPFRLAWLEALLRIADWRASATEETLDHDDL